MNASWHTLHPMRVQTQLEAYRRTLRRLTWMSGSASVLLGLTTVAPLLLKDAFAPGLRAVVGLVSAALVVASVLSARAIRARVADAQFLGADWTRYARDLKVRADHDPAARAEYVAYLRDSRDLVLQVPEQLKRRGIVTEQTIAPALAAVDAEIATYEKPLLPMEAERMRDDG